MSTPFAVAAVTRTLRNLLTRVATEDFSGLPDDTRPNGEIRITTLPPDRVQTGEDAGNQLNLFLYHAVPSPAYRNMDLPRRVRPGERGHPPLALNLHYLVTAHGEGDSELVAHALLGTALGILHDHPVLGREEIRDALPASHLDEQFERIRITPHSLGLDDLSRLWAGFQSEYRLSAAFQASVVLIESRRPTTAPLPVLRRGPDDEGVRTVAGPGPTLLRIRSIHDPGLPERPRSGKPAAELGDVLILEGAHLRGGPVDAILRHPLLDTPLELPVSASTDPGFPAGTGVEVALPPMGSPGAAAAWPPGIYTVELRYAPPDAPALHTNRLPFPLAPSLESLSPDTLGVGAQPFDLTVTCRPQVRAGQAVSLLLGNREFAPEPPVAPGAPDDPSTLVFQVHALGAGAHVARLRVDGADSVPIDFSVSPPVFDGGQTLSLTP